MESRDALRAMLIDLCQASEQIGRNVTIRKAGGQIDEADHAESLNLRHDRFDRILAALAASEPKREPDAWLVENNLMSPERAALYAEDKYLKRPVWIGAARTPEPTKGADHE